jgi:hypothetical protein
MRMRCVAQGERQEKELSLLLLLLLLLLGARGSLVVKALGYKPEGRGFETQ